MMTQRAIVNGKNIEYDDFCNGHGDAMAEGTDWTLKVKGILRGELKRRNLGYKELVEKLEVLGIQENERNLANKIARGTFTAVFFIQCLIAIDCKTVRLSDD